MKVHMLFMAMIGLMMSTAADARPAKITFRLSVPAPTPVVVQPLYVAPAAPVIAAPPPVPVATVTYGQPVTPCPQAMAYGYVTPTPVVHQVPVRRPPRAVYMVPRRPYRRPSASLTVRAPLGR